MSVQLVVASVTQTGDISHIVGALALCRDIALLIFFDNGFDRTQLEELCRRAAGYTLPSSGRVNFVQITSPPAPRDAHKNTYNILKHSRDLSQLRPVDQNVVSGALGSEWNAFRASLKELTLSCL